MSDAAIVEALRAAVLAAIPDAVVEAGGGGGHFTLEVVAKVFDGKSMIDSHRLVYAAIAPLMAGSSAPVHAIDKLITRAR